MGARVWKRDASGEGGRVFTTGFAAVAPEAHPRALKRKRVWRLEDQQQGPAMPAANGQNGAPHSGEPARQHSGMQSGGSGSLPRQRSGSQPLHKSGSLPEAGLPDPENVEDHFAKRVRHGDTAEVNGWHQHGWHQAPQPRPPPHWQQTPRGRGRGRGRGRLTDSHPGNISQHSNGQAAAPSAVQMQAAAAAEAAEREAAAQAAAEAKLQQSEAQIADLKQRIAQQQAEKAARQKAQEAADARHAREEQERRKANLAAGFTEAFKQAKSAADEELARSKAVRFASPEEVQRVLKAKDDYDCLQVKAGVDVLTLKRKYKEMAVTLHPDKCKVPGATDAFQRLVQSYHSLRRIAGG